MSPELSLGRNQLLQFHLSLCPLIHRIGESLLSGRIVGIERGISSTLRCS